MEFAIEDSRALKLMAQRRDRQVILTSRCSTLFYMWAQNVFRICTKKPS